MKYMRDAHTITFHFKLYTFDSADFLPDELKFDYIYRRYSHGTGI